MSATKVGKQMPLAEVVEKVIPRLAECRVRRVTLTGGEPTIHPDFLDIVRAFRAAGMDVGICTTPPPWTTPGSGSSPRWVCTATCPWTGSPPTRTASSAVTGPASMSPWPPWRSSARPGFCRACCARRTRWRRTRSTPGCARSPGTTGPATCCSTRWAA
ncbi:MAG: hypothetical protein ACRDQ9_13660 [Pseudonocardiaceae bacterium]